MDGMSSNRTNTAESLWDVTDLATYLRTSRKAVYHLIERSDGPPVIRLSKRTLRFDPAAVRAWVQERQA